MASNGSLFNDQRELPHAVYKVFNDAVHGHIKLHQLCTKIVDTEEFQRLRNIKQTGVAYLVYPAACHNRFEHSLGVCYLAGQLLDKLEENDKHWMESNRFLTGDNKITEKEKLCVQIAGLCHDLGHGPFSHTWEHVVKAFNPDSKWKHETSSIDIFSKIAENLKDEFDKFHIKEKEKEFIKDLIRGLKTEVDEKCNPDSRKTNEVKYPKEKYFLFEIIANKHCEVDVDKWDYMLRDGKLLNLNSTFDYRRLLEFCAVVKLEDGTYHIGFKKSEINSLYDIFKMRAEFHFKAYQHPVVKNIERMLIDGFAAAGNYKVNGRIELREAHNKCENFLKLTDHIFWNIVYDEDPSTAKTIFSNIMKRKLYKLIGKWDILETSRNEKKESDIQNEAKELLKEECGKDYYKKVKFEFINVSLAITDKKNYPTLYKKDRKNGKAIVVKFDEKMLLYPIERSHSHQCQLLVFYDNTVEDCTDAMIKKMKKVINKYIDGENDKKKLSVTI